MSKNITTDDTNIIELSKTDNIVITELNAVNFDKKKVAILLNDFTPQTKILIGSSNNITKSLDCGCSCKMYIVIIFMLIVFILVSVYYGTTIYNKFKNDILNSEEFKQIKSLL